MKQFVARSIGFLSMRPQRKRQNADGVALCMGQTFMPRSIDFVYLSRD